MEVAVMANVARRDIRTVTGSNCALILRETGMSPVSCCIGKLKQVLKMRITTAPDTDRWRLEYLGKLLTQRGEASYIADNCEILRLYQLTVLFLADDGRRCPSTLRHHAYYLHQQFSN